MSSVPCGISAVSMHGEGRGAHYASDGVMTRHAPARLSRTRATISLRA
ncbi:hypothetical protein JI752_017560 [Lysobacter sp. MMG2]|nr:hypothetical protein [Lysobacter sp. MMG2]MBU8977959.1 hypothetical protein [Lysobacter sp. MMG2]